MVLDFSTESDMEIEAESLDDSVSEPQLRRSMRERLQPNYYGMEQSHLTQVQSQPCHLRKIHLVPKALDGQKMGSLVENDVWELVQLPACKKAVRSILVYKVKTGADGSLEYYKAKLVAQSFAQRYGSDYDETFCPVVRQESLKVLIALS